MAGNVSGIGFWFFAIAVPLFVLVTWPMLSLAKTVKEQGSKNDEELKRLNENVARLLEHSMSLQESASKRLELLNSSLKAHADELGESPE